MLVCITASLPFLLLLGTPANLTPPTSPAQSISPADRVAIRAAHQRSLFAAHETPDGLTARNPRQEWDIRFDGSSVLVEPDHKEWTWGLELESYGFSDQLTPVPAHACTHVEDGQVSYGWSETLEEWYVNDTRGVEHGFTVRARPEGPQDGPLILSLRVSGELAPVVLENRQDIHFKNGTGEVALKYSGLVAFDATGRFLTAWFEETAEGFTLSVDECGALYPLTIDPVLEEAVLWASNQDVDDFFGTSVAISGDTAVVGAVGEDSNATGSNGNESDNSASSSGAAYVFVRTGTPAKWSQEAYLKASNTGADDMFGVAVAISGDTIVVGASQEDSNETGTAGTGLNNLATDAGAAYVFLRTGTSWSQQAYIKASNTGAGDLFGSTLAIAGNTLVVGAPDEDSNETGTAGTGLNNLATDAGAAYVFLRTGTSWSQQAYIKASNTGAGDLFGTAVAISGDTMIAGAPDEDSNETGTAGSGLNDLATDAGAAYVFLRTGTSWSQEAYMKASNTQTLDLFGASVAVSSDTAIVGAPEEDSNALNVGGNQSNNAASESGAAYVYGRSGTAWSQQAYLKASNTGADDLFGSSVGVSGVLAVVGAPGEDSPGTGINSSETGNSSNFPEAGAAYLFEDTGSPMTPNWTSLAYIKPSTPGFYSLMMADDPDLFGMAIAISDETIVAGASGQNSPTGFETGKAYVFDDLTAPVFFTTDSCSGDGGVMMGCTDCPCMNNATAGTIGGCLNSEGNSARLMADGDTSVSLPADICTDLRFTVTGATAFTLCILQSGDAVAPDNPANPCFGLDSGVQSSTFDGLRCAITNTIRYGGRTSDHNGDIGIMFNDNSGVYNSWGGPGNPGAGIASVAGFTSGQIRYFQGIYREDVLLGCMTGLNTTQSIEVTFAP